MDIEKIKQELLEKKAKIIPPTGLIINPTAKTAKDFKSSTVAFPEGKNNFPIIAAKNP
jgi:hypothetical protein